mgnify:FL=1
MIAVVIELPSLLANIVGGAQIEARGATIREVLTDATSRTPALAIHLFDETGDLREHVLCFHNGRNTRWDGTLDGPVADGDRIAIIQAVSGG